MPGIYHVPSLLGQYPSNNATGTTSCTYFVLILHLDLLRYQLEVSERYLTVSLLSIGSLIHDGFAPHSQFSQLMRLAPVPSGMWLGFVRRDLQQCDAI
jgi:hypothetical protein